MTAKFSQYSQFHGNFYTKLTQENTSNKRAINNGCLLQRDLWHAEIMTQSKKQSPRVLSSHNPKKSAMIKRNASQKGLLRYYQKMEDPFASRVRCSHRQNPTVFFARKLLDLHFWQEDHSQHGSQASVINLPETKQAGPAQLQKMLLQLTHLTSMTNMWVQSIYFSPTHSHIS